MNIDINTITEEEKGFLSFLKSKDLDANSAFAELQKARDAGKFQPKEYSESQPDTPTFKRRSEKLSEESKTSGKIAEAVKEPGRFGIVGDIVSGRDIGPQVQGIKEAGKAGLKSIGAGASAISEKLTELGGKLGVSLGTKIEELKGNITPEQAKQTYIDIVTDPDFFNQDSQDKADLLTTLGSFLIPAGVFTGAKGISGGIKSGAASGLLGTTIAEVATEGELPSVGQGLTGAAIGGTLGGTLGAVGSKLSGKTAQSETAKNLSDKILQVSESKMSKGGIDATERVSKKGFEGLKSINTEGVKTYKDLSKSFGKSSSKIGDKLNDYLTKNNKVLQGDDLTIVTKTPKGNTITEEPIRYALDDLLDVGNRNILGIKRKDLSELIDLKQTRDTGEFTIKDANRLSQLYSKYNSGFTAGGDAATATSKQGYEITRNALKEVARKNLPDDTAKILDKEWSNVITGKNMAEQMAGKVKKLEDRLSDTKFADKVGQTFEKGTEYGLTGGVRGFIRGVIRSINSSFSRLDDVQMERELPKRLKKIDELLSEKKPGAFAEKMKNIIDDNLQDTSSLGAKSITTNE